MQKIEEAAERGELTELVLMVIWNRLDLARRDVSRFHTFALIYKYQVPRSCHFSIFTACVFSQEEKDAIRSLDLLYRRVEV